jgi:coenzyme F420-0:L-glutamate ligase/coenzyme F420-1:gamma-L-glutamate ligase
MPTEPCNSLAAFAIPGFPMVKQGDDLVVLIVETAARADIKLQAGDIVVLAQKVVSKAEGRYLDLKSLRPSPRALELAARTGKDPQLVEAILLESTEIVGVGPNIIIAAHRNGVVLANAGIDRSNVGASADDSVVLLLPLEPDRSCREIRQGLLDRL